MTTKDKLEFVHAMGKHSAATLWDCQRLMRLGATFHRLMEEACNRELTPAEWLKSGRIKHRIEKITDSFGGKPKFSGDPRGATVKIKVPDGYTNDWGNEGICVPTS